jgi:8-oxo-dGTP diphosphatase
MESVAKVGLGVIVSRSGRILMLRRSNVHGDGSWSVPGGHIDAGESLEECAKREVAEETGVTIKDIRFLAVTNDIFEAEEKHYVTIWMAAEYDGGDAFVAAPYEASHVGWFDPSKPPRPLFVPVENLMNGRHYPEDAVHEMLNMPVG